MFLGCSETRVVWLYKKNYTHTTLKHSHTMAQKHSAFHSIFIGAVFLTILMLWQCTMLSACKSNSLNKTGTVSERVSVSSNRGIEWGLSERVCHTMLLLREASCPIPSIGTSRHERRVCDGRRMLQSNLWAEGANELSALCRALLLLFTRWKVKRERLEENISLQQKG